MDHFLGLIVLVGMFLLYWLPTIVAYRRKHQSRMGIMLVNLLLGWTVIGWIVGIIWAASHVVPQSQQA